MVIKMRLVNSTDFEQALTACQMAFGCLVVRKRTLVHIVVFDNSDVLVIRDTLEEVGSHYAGRYFLYERS